MREGIGSLARILKTIEVSSTPVPSGYCLWTTYVFPPGICPHWSNFRGIGTVAAVACNFRWPLPRGPRSPHHVTRICVIDRHV
jgi:hypothetical protein